MTSTLPHKPKMQVETGPLPAYELAELSSQSSQETLPTYDAATTYGSASSTSARTSISAAAATSGLNATHAYQIETRGHPLIALPIPPSMDPICVYSVLPTGEIGELVYQSMREKRSSGTSTLFKIDNTPMCTTTYRFGPGRPPTIQLSGEDETFQFSDKGITTRAQNLRTHLGTFQWRYASRQERDAVGGANSLIVLDHITNVALAGGGKKETRRRIAQLVRNEELRASGSSASTAGNGGRLVMDLTGWADRKIEVEQLQILVLTSCIVMLKKEVDRRRAVQFGVLFG